MIKLTVEPWKIEKVGTVFIPPNHKGPIELKGWEFEGVGTCREGVVLALIHAIGELQFALAKTVQEPGGDGTVSMD